MKTCRKCKFQWNPKTWPAERCPSCRKAKPAERTRLAVCQSCDAEWETWVSQPKRCRVCGAGRNGKNRPKVSVL